MPPRHRSPRRSRTPHTLHLTLRGRLLVLAAFLLVLTVVILSIRSTFADQPRIDQEVTLDIPQDFTLDELALKLEQEKIVKGPRLFKWRSLLAGKAGDIKAGRHTLARGASFNDIWAELSRSVAPPKSQVTVPEGSSLNDIASLLEQKGIPREDFLAAAQVDDQALPLAGAEQAVNLEGFLFPATFELGDTPTAKRFVEEALTAFQRKTAGLPWQNGDRLGLTPFEVLTVASLIEREARVAEERPLIAQVIYNRLRADMKLDIDATVQYALGSWKSELTKSDLEIDSPYNTRRYKDLPPGPICNPGLPSIEAALNPANSDALYYVAKGDGSGAHTFTNSYDEFLKAQGL